MTTDWDDVKERLAGCYVTVPTMFRDDDLELDLPAIRRHVRFLIEGGIRTETGTLLAGGAAGDFSTMSFDERVRVAETIVREAAGRVPVAMGAQTTSTHELVELARSAESVGAEYIQVSPPFYFSHTEDDFFEYVRAASQAAEVGIIVYNTFWTSANVSADLVERLVELPNVVGLKWSARGDQMMGFERAVARFAGRLCIIDNQMNFAVSHILGARGLELHQCNYWPKWGVHVWNLLEAGQYAEAERELVRVAAPFFELWEEMERYTSGDGYLDKLCMELIGIGSSRCRPPTRDVRDIFREKTRQMLIQTGVPGVVPSRGR